MVDILFCAHGRPEFTRATLQQLCGGTEFGTRKTRLHMYNDGDDRFRLDPNLAGSIFSIQIQKLGGPVACLNRFLQRSGSDIVVKLDNDTIVPPGWLEASLDVMHRYPGVDLLGLEAWSPERQLFPEFVNPEPGTFRMCKGVRMVSHIGGIGLFRRSAFERFGLPQPNAEDGRFGFTEWQWSNPSMVKAFLDPPLPVFLLDHLPFEPWRSLSVKYEAAGEQRRVWGEYDAEKHKALWEWWMK